MASIEKKSFVVYTDYKKHLKLLPFDEVGKLFMSLLEYVETGESNQNLSPVASMALSFIQDQIDRDLEKYEETCIRNRENGKKGGRPRTKAEASDKNPKVIDENPTVSEKTERLNSKPKKPYNDNEDVCDNDSEDVYNNEDVYDIDIADGSDSDAENDIDNDVVSESDVVNCGDDSGDSDCIAKTENTSTATTNTDTADTEQKINPKTEDKTSRDIACYSVTENGAVIEQKNPLIPTPEEVRSYCLKRKSCIDPERFYNYYHIRDWKVGTKPMDDWKACVRVWEKKEGNGYNDIQNTQPLPQQYETYKKTKPKNSFLDYEQRAYTEEELKELLRQRKSVKSVIY